MKTQIQLLLDISYQAARLDSALLEQELSGISIKDQGDLRDYGPYLRGLASCIDQLQNHKIL